MIALFNPEMAPEWGVLHDAELVWNWNKTDDAPRWLATAPRDDGTLAAAVTAQRITQGTPEPPILEARKTFIVERLGSAPGILASQVGDGVVVAGTRDDLRRGIRSLMQERPWAAESDRGSFDSLGPGTAAGRLDSGLLIRIDPSRLNGQAGPIAYRRAVAGLNGVGCESLTGALALQNDVLALELNTALRRQQRNAPAAGTRVRVDRAWLTWVPAERTMAAFSLAIAPGAEFWESAFALADHLERADPQRADVAPLRSRLNLMAAAAGVRIEADLWCHLIGVTASVFADRDQTGQIGGIVVILHADEEASAARIAAHVLPGLAYLFLGTNRGPENKPGAMAALSQRLGTVSGRELAVSRRGATSSSVGETRLEPGRATSSSIRSAPWLDFFPLGARMVSRFHSAWARSGRLDAGRRRPELTGRRRAGEFSPTIRPYSGAAGRSEIRPAIRSRCRGSSASPRVPRRDPARPVAVALREIGVQDGSPHASI